MSEIIEYIVKDGCFIERMVQTQERPLGTYAKVLRSLADEAYSLVPDVGIVEVPARLDYEQHESKEEKVKLPVHIGRNSSRLYAAHRLPYWPIFGHFNTTAEPGGPIVYRYNGIEGGQRRCGVAYPGMWIIYRFNLSNHRITNWGGASLITNIRGRHYAPLLPNIFDSGKICFGDVRPRWTGNIVDCCQHVLDELFASASNDHLMTDQHRSVLQFTRETPESLFTFKPPENFWSAPESRHRGRDTTVAADMLVNLATLEETDYSLKVSDEHPPEETEDEQEPEYREGGEG